MLDETVQNHIRELCDEDLYDYIRADPEMYTPAAMEFAVEEFKRRGLNESDIARLSVVTEERAAVRSAEEMERATQPLAWRDVKRGRS